MGLSKKDKYRWVIEMLDGKHEITVKMGSSSRAPLPIYIDGQYACTAQYSGFALIPSMEYKFTCGEETVTLVLHGSDIDMVYHGNLVHHKMEYNPTDTLPIGYGILCCILTIAAFSELWIFDKLLSPSVSSSAYNFVFIAINMLLCCTVSLSRGFQSPFKTRKQKLRSCLFSVLWAWVITFLIIVLFAALGMASA